MSRTLSSCRGGVHIKPPADPPEAGSLTTRSSVQSLTDRRLVEASYATLLKLRADLAHPHRPARGLDDRLDSRLYGYGFGAKRFACTP